MLGKVDGLLSAETADSVSRSQLAQLKLSLKEKLDTLTHLDAEILELTEDNRLEDEISQADGFKDNNYTAMVKLDAVPLTTPTSYVSYRPYQTSEAHDRTFQWRPHKMDALLGFIHLSDT